MRRSGFLIPVSLAVLALVLVLLAISEEQPSLAVYRQPEEWTGQITHTVSLPHVTRNYDPVYTVSLPLVTRAYDPAYVPPFGIVMYGSVNDAAGLQSMQQAGAKWASTMFTWATVEPQPGAYDWSLFDAKAAGAQAAGMSLFVLFTGNPRWAADLPGGPVTHTQDLVNIVTRMAERYDCDGKDDAAGHPCVHYWSFYAEPDNGNYLRAKNTGKGYWGHNGAGYAAMLSEISPAIHAANAKARVLIGGLAYDWFEEQAGPFVRSFLTDTLQALNGYPGGAPAYIDAVAFHYYPLNPEWPTIKEKAAEFRGIMANWGAAELPLLCPETGYWSSLSHGSSEEQQAYWLVQLMVRGISVDVQVISWHKVFDDVVPGSPDDKYPTRTSGLLRLDRSFKPSYYAYQTVTRELTGLHYAGALEAAGVEGYVFITGRGKDKTVLWGLSDPRRVTFPYTHLRLVRATGEEYDIRDNEPTVPGDLDGGVPGQIELEFSAGEPFFVEQK